MSKGLETDERLSRMRLDCDCIFRAGLAAVEPGKSVFRHCQRHGDILEIDGTVFDLSRFHRVLLLGAGKAGAPMAGALEKILGGRLASAVYPGTLACLVLSDVIGNDLDIIASGPGVPDPGTFEQCMEIVHDYGLESRLPVLVQKHLKKGAEKRVRETPKPGDPVFDNTCHSVVACGMDALKAAAAKAEALGYHSYILSDDVRGETVDAAGEHVRIALSVKAGAHDVSPPACLLSGGETTVTLQNPGKGGRNQEFALKCALDIAGLDNIAVLSAGTDGTDGPTDAAGGLVDTSTERRAEKSGFDARHHLDGHDAYPLLEAAGDLYKTGPTFTNVMDMRVILVK